MPVNDTLVVRVACLMSLLVLGLPACRTEINKEATRPAVDEVLRPLAVQQTDERINQARALLAQINLAKEQRAAGQPSPRDTQVLLKRVVALVEPSPDDARSAELLRSFADLSVRQPLGARKTQYHEVLEWLDRRRAPLRNELTQRLIAKTVPTDKGFLVCVDGVQRQYEKSASGRFARVSDKPGAC